MMERMKRDYLTSEEISFIANEMLKANDAFSREMIKYGLIAQMLIADLEEFDTCNQIYDYLVENNFNICNVVSNIGTLEKIVSEELSVQNTVKVFLNEISEKIDEYAKNIDKSNLENLIKEFKSIANVSTQSSEVLNNI